MSGTLNPELFQKSYGFLVDQKENEIKVLQKEIKSAKKKKYSAEDLQRLREALGKNKDEMYRFKKNEEVREIKKSHKDQMKERMNKGQGAFYMKKSKKKKISY